MTAAFRARAGLAIPALVVLAEGVWGLDRGSMWQDEATTAAIAGRPLPELWHTLAGVDAVHGAYYVLLHGLIVLFGGAVPMEVLIRIPSLLAAAAAAVGVCAVGRITWSPAAGLLSGSVFAALPIVSRYAQEARSYALVMAALVWATYFLLRGRSVGYAIALAAGCLLNLFAVFVVLAHGTALLISRASAATLKRWAAAAVAGVVPAAPVAWVASGQTEQVSWLSPPGWVDVRALLSGWAGGVPPLALLGLLCVAGALAGFLPTGDPKPGASGESPGPGTSPARSPLGGLATPTPAPAPTPQGGGLRTAVTERVSTRQITDVRVAALGAPGGENRTRPTLPALAVPLAVLPPAALLAVSRFHPLYQDRYVLYSVAGLAWLAGAALGCLRRTVIAVPVVLALAALTLPAQQQVRRIDSRADDPAAAAHVVADESRPGDAVLFLPSVRRLVAEAYPGSFSGLRDVALARTGGESGTLAGREGEPRQVAKSLRRADRVWVVSRSDPSPADLSAPTDRAKRHELRDHFRQAALTRVLGYAVRLYVRKS